MNEKGRPLIAKDPLDSGALNVHFVEFGGAIEIFSLAGGQIIYDGHFMTL
jgi:hypothetical protein